MKQNITEEQLEELNETQKENMREIKKQIEVSQETRILGDRDCCGNKTDGNPHFHNGDEDHETIIITTISGDRICSTRKKNKDNELIKIFKPQFTSDTHNCKASYSIKGKTCTVKIKLTKKNFIQKILGLLKI